MRRFLLVLLPLVMAKVFVLSPKSLQNSINNNNGLEDGEVASSLGNFGNPPYGSRLEGQVFLPPGIETEACSPLEHIPDKKDKNAFLLVDRGKCAFVVKARNAQDAGYLALLVINNRDEEPSDVVMTDNGAGGNLFIPAFLIKRKDGNFITNFINNSIGLNQPVIMKLEFEIEKFRRAHLKILFSPENKKAMNLFAEFAPYSEHFNDTNFKFRPYFALWYCIDCAQKNFNESEPDCISGGRYCAPDPDGLGPRSGRDTVLEDLREACLFKEIDKKTIPYAGWFKYMAMINNTCLVSGINETCSYKAMVKLGLPKENVEQCVRTSVDGGGDIAVNNNSVLKDELRLWRNLGIEYYPAMILNNNQYRGDWEGLQLAQSLCAGFVAAPEFCADYLAQRNGSKKSSLGAGTVWLIVIVSIGLVIAVLLLYRAWAKRELNIEMKQQVNLAVSQYYALSSHEGSQLSERNQRQSGRK